MNRALVEIYGDDAIGTPCYQVFRRASGPCVDCTNHRLVDANGRPAGAVRWEGTDPLTGRHLLNTDQAVRWIDGRLVRLQVAVDITEVKQMQRQRLALEQQLAQAQKLESVGRLAGGIAHDFNNMLGVILGNVELARLAGPLSDDMARHLEEIHKAASRSARLTRQLLAFARRQSAAPRVLALNEAVSGALSMLERLLGETVRVLWRPAPDLWPVKIDPDQVDQVLANLCVNAADAMQGAGTVTIDTANVSFAAPVAAAGATAPAGDYVRLRVADTGCGMDQQTMENIFEPFFTTKQVGEGTGLGLSTVYGIVRQNDGFIQVDSRPGKGATFSIYLPRAADPVQQTCAEEAVPAGGNETCLVVEDEPAILEVARSALESCGYRVLAAPSPAQALEIAAAHPGPIHLLISDVVMPGADGPQLARRIARLRPAIRVIFISGYAKQVLRDKGLKDPGAPVVAKPFSVAELTAAVRKALDEQAPYAG